MMLIPKEVIDAINRQYGEWMYVWYVGEINSTSYISIQTVTA